MKTITPPELKCWQVDNKKFILLDVREDWERNAYNIGGEHIPFGELMVRKNELDATATIVLYCEKGIRSAIAIQRLGEYGFNDLYNLEGGMVAWRKNEVQQ